MFSTYILHSPSLDRYYVGQTADLRQRMAFHVAGSTAATSGAKDWVLVFVQSFPTRAAAMRLETTIKGKKSHTSIQRFVADPRNEAKRAVAIADW